jgi:hypothetical protein
MDSNAPGAFISLGVPLCHTELTLHAFVCFPVANFPHTEGTQDMSHAKQRLFH